MVALRPLIDDDIGAIERRRLAPLARLNLDNVHPLDGTLSKKLLEYGLHLLPGNGVVNAGDVDRWNSGHLDRWKLVGYICGRGGKDFNFFFDTYKILREKKLNN